MKRQLLVLIEKFAFRTTAAVATEAMKLNLDVIVIVPSDLPASLLADAPFRVKTISDWATESLDRQLREIEKEERIAGIGSVLGFFTGGGLLGAQVAQLCAARGLPHTPSDALFRANNKYLMRKVLRERGVYTVRFARVLDEASLQTAAEEVGFPLILKPVVGVGSSFISRCNNIEEMRQVFQHYLEHVSQGYYAHFFAEHCFEGETFSPLQEMLAEEAIDGSEISVECLCTQDQVNPLIIHDKLDVEQAAYCSFENLLVTPPVRLDQAAQEKVRAYTRDVVQALGLVNCFCHVELRYDSQQRPSVMEVNPRVGGMRVKDSLRTIAGIPYAQYFIHQLLGRPVPLPPAPITTGLHAMLAIYPRRSGTLQAVRGVETASALPGMLDIACHVAPGSKVGGSFEEVFVVDAWFRGKSLDDVLELDRQVKALVELVVEH